MNPITKAEIYLFVLAIVGAGLAGMYFYAKHEGRLEERAVWEKNTTAATKTDLVELQTALKTANDIATGTQNLLNAKRATNTIDRGVIQREIQTNTVYAADCLPDTGRLQWDALSKSGTVLPNSTTVIQSVGPVPAGNGPSPTRWQSGVTAPLAPSGKTNIR